MGIAFKQTAINTKGHYHTKGEKCIFCEKRCPICRSDFDKEGTKPFTIKGREVFCAKCGCKMPHLEAEIIPVIDPIKEIGGITC